MRINSVPSPHLLANVCRRAAAVSAICCIVFSCLAQVDRAGLDGTVTDPSGKVIPGVRVSATMAETGMQRAAVTSPEGTYDIPELPLGTCTVFFEANGFAPLAFNQVVLTVGHTRTLNARLQMAGAKQLVQIYAGAVDLNQTSDSLGARIERKQIQQLPMNGRNWSTLTALVPGAIDTGGSNQRSIRFAGRGLDDNNFTYDGIDATNIVNQAQQPFVRLSIPTDTIQEFRIDTMLFTAENGSTPGGQVAVVSKSGSNEFHGNAFEFLRNDIFDAREPIDNLNPFKPPFRLNQFGGSLGGPVTRGRTFFFVSYEGLRQTLGQTLPGFVPSDSFREEVALASPAVIPILNAFPHAQMIVDGTNGQIAEFVGEGRQIDREDSEMIRLDHVFSSRDSADLRFNFDAALSNVPLAGGGSYLNDRQEITSRPVNGAIEYLHLFSASLVNEAKIGFNRGNVYTTNQGVLNLPYSVTVSSFSTLNNNEFKLGVGNSYSWIDNLTWVKGQHTLKFGGEVRRIQLNQGNTANGSVTFSSPSNLSANSVSSASYAAELPINGLRKTEVYAFAQDEWKMSPNLTLNIGLRYMFFNRFHEILGRAIPFDFATCGPKGFCGAGATFGKRRWLDFDPRVSAAWEPAVLGGKTVIRSGFGIYHGDGQLDDQNLPISNEVQRFSLSARTIPNLSFPVDSFLANTPGIVSPRNMDRRRSDMYVVQWGGSVQQSLPASYLATLSYVGSKGTHLLTTSYINLIDPATGTREYSGFGQVEYRGNSNNSYYEAFVATIQRSFTSNLSLSTSYVYAHGIDQGAAGGGDSDFPQNPACLACERASGDFDVRHVFSASTVYELPFGHGRAFLSGSGFANDILGNWDVSSVVSARTALPVNVTIDRSSSSVATGYTTSQRPNRVSGVPLTPSGGAGIHHWINPAAFESVTDGSYGNTPRNVARGPSLWQADFGLVKHIPLTDALTLQFRTEFFNIFNRSQYGLPLADFSSAGNFGSINNPVNVGPVGTGTPRQIQFMVRLEF
jgi:hypothetical protein